MAAIPEGGWIRSPVHESPQSALIGLGTVASSSSETEIWERPLHSPRQSLLRRPPTVAFGYISLESFTRRGRDELGREQYPVNATREKSQI